MAQRDFTYDLSTDIGKMRLMLGDTRNDCGVKPDDTCFADAELSVFLDQEGDVNNGVALACETLARMFSSHVDIAVGPRRESLSQASENWAKRAIAIRDMHGPGGTSGPSGSFVTGFNRGESGEDEYAR
jgi:hypothetical protein